MNCSRSEDLDGRQEGAKICEYLCSYGSPFSGENWNRTGSPNSKGIHCGTNLCSQGCACGSVALCTVQQKNLSPTPLECKHVLAEFTQEAGIRQHYSSAVGAVSLGSTASFLRFRQGEKLSVRSPSFCRTAFNYGKTECVRCLAREKSLKCSVEVH